MASSVAYRTRRASSTTVVVTSTGPSLFQAVLAAYLISLAINYVPLMLYAFATHAREARAARLPTIDGKPSASTDEGHCCFSCHSSYRCWRSHRSALGANRRTRRRCAAFGRRRHLAAVPVLVLASVRGR